MGSSSEAIFLACNADAAHAGRKSFRTAGVVIGREQQQQPRLAEPATCIRSSLRVAAAAAAVVAASESAAGALAAAASETDAIAAAATEAAA